MILRIMITQKKQPLLFIDKPPGQLDKITAPILPVDQNLLEIHDYRSCPQLASNQHGGASKQFNFFHFKSTTLFTIPSCIRFERRGDIYDAFLKLGCCLIC
ncbi:hypothetical protein RSP795_22565 [Ralstonia solanacearum]|nr:hypothetical protein RSP795_22565 [Ralstonia solanacearum]